MTPLAALLTTVHHMAVVVRPRRKFRRNRANPLTVDVYEVRLRDAEVVALRVAARQRHGGAVVERDANVSWQRVRQGVDNAERQVLLCRDIALFARWQWRRAAVARRRAFAEQT